MARAADNFFNPRRNFEIEVNAAGLYDYVKRNQILYFPPGLLPYGTILLDADFADSSTQVICTQDRGSGFINKVNAGDLTLIPRGAQDFTDIEDETGSKNLPAFQVHNFEKYQIPGDFEETLSTAFSDQTAVTRFLRKYELSCFEYSRTFAEYLQNYFYIACINNNSQSTTFFFPNPQAVIDYYNALFDNEMINYTLQIWSSIFHSAVQKASIIYNYFSLLYPLPLPGAPSPFAATGKPYVGSLASSDVQNVSVEIVERENRNLTHGNINLSKSESWQIVYVVNLNGFPASGFICFEMGLLGAYDGLSLSSGSGGKFGFTDNYGTGVSFNTSFNPWFGRTAIIHFCYEPVNAFQSQFKIFINGELMETKLTAGLNGDLRINQLLNSNASVQPSGKHYLRRIAQGQTPNNTQVLNEYNSLRELFPEYPSVVIGSQEWTVENCNQITTALGYTIPEVTNNAAWAALTTPGWCYYNNNPQIGAVYGKLYNWYAVKKIYDDAVTYNLTAPANRKINFIPAISADFTTLANALGGASFAGGKMKKAGLIYWQSPNAGATNESRFTALGCGFRTTTGTFSSVGFAKIIWGVDNLNSPSLAVLYNTNAASISANDAKLQGGSIRLIKTI